jgi:A/G-specific adenine glycosylase
MDFATTIADWQSRHGRHDLPWQNTRDPYRIWLSEIMLQQTQVATVIPYYHRFLERFPDLAALAAAEEDDVMPYWAGLGYYARARNLHRCARAIVRDWGGRFPPSAAEIATLPGIGRSTAAAIAAFAYNEPSPIMDGNVKRVFTRHFGIAGDPSRREVELRLWELADQQVRGALEVRGGPGAGAQAGTSSGAFDMAAYTQGLMDLGATLCVRANPRCAHCPVNTTCIAMREGRQGELPTPKARKTGAERQTGMLVLCHDGHILLQRRPSPGIWGGLWSLPEFASGTAAQEACRILGAEPASIARLAPFAHTFTHFRLHVEPWFVELSTRMAVEDGGWRWLARAESAAAALPAPVRKLLDGLYQAGLAGGAPATLFEQAR